MENQKYITLHNGVKMPVLGIGTFILSPDEAEASVLCALQNGCRLIDTANAYVNEKAVGRAIKKPVSQEKKFFLKLSCGRRFMRSLTPWRKHSKDLIPILLIYF